MLSFQLNISQEEYFTKYTEYLSKMNHRERILSKYYGNSISDSSAETVSEDDYDDNEYIKKIFAFQHSSEFFFFMKFKIKIRLHKLIIG